MRSLLLAWLTAVWMLRKRHFLAWRRRMRFFRACLRPLKIDLIRCFESDLQTISGFALCPEYFGTAPLFGSGKNAWRSGWAAAVLASSAKAPSRTSSVHTLLIRTATYTNAAPARVSCRDRPNRRPGSARAGARSGERVGRKPRVQHLKFKYGPVTIHPGQNTISIDGDGVPRPKVPGWIVGFRPNLERLNGTIPRVDVLHLHHAVWLINGAPTFAAGEEKTNVRLPKGYGWRYDPSDQWVLNHMIHNLLPNHDRVYITYTLDFIPDSSPAAKGMRPVRTLWMDVEAGKAYPVFDVHRGSGRERALHLPRRRARRLRRRAAAQPARHPPRRRAGGDGRAPAPRRALHRPQAHARGPHGQPVPLAGALLGAGRRGLVGRGDDGHALRLARQGQARRRAQRVGDLRLQARVLVRVDGDRPGRLRARRARRRRPVLGQARPPRAAHARAPAREPQPRRQDGRPLGPAHARRRPGRAGPAGDLQLPLRPGRPAARRRRLAPARDRSRPEPDVRQPRRGATRSTTRSRPAGRPATARRASPTRSPTGPWTSTPASSATARRASRPPPTGTRGRRRATSARAPTATSAGSTRSCGAASA